MKEQDNLKEKKIISWNVNGIRAVEKKGFLRWLADESPDMICLQETKAEPAQLSASLRTPLDREGKPYFSYWASAEKKGYAGTAIYSKTEPLNTGVLGLREFDGEGRVLQADYEDFSLICAYFPNTQRTTERLPYKLAFCEAMLAHCNKLTAQGRRLLLCGDYNIAHTAIDLARPAENEGNAGFLPEERAWMDAWLSAGYADTFRRFHPDEPGHYTWWTYRASARKRNVGWRIDYHCVDNAFLPFVEKSIIRAEVTGSDHCPIEIVLNI
jgi:exodeoxyribonuclease-3